MPSKEVDNSPDVMYNSSADSSSSDVSDVGSIDSIIFGGGGSSSGASESSLDVESLVSEQSRGSAKNSGKSNDFSDFGDPALAAQAIRTTLKQDKSEEDS